MLFRLNACKKSVCFCWVPSHAENTGHECGDSLAHSAFILGWNHFTKVPSCDYFHFLTPFYLGVGNPSSLTSQVIKFLDISTCHKNRHLTDSYLMTHSLTFGPPWMLWKFKINRWIRKYIKKFIPQTSLALTRKSLQHRLWKLL